MLSVNIKGTLGKYGYSDIPDEITDQILSIAVDTAEVTAKAKVPVGTAPQDPHPGLLRDLIRSWIEKAARIGFVSVKSPYALAVHYGDKRHFPHPFMQQAADAARRIIKSTIRKSTKAAIEKGK